MVGCVGDQDNKQRPRPPRQCWTLSLSRLGVDFKTKIHKTEVLIILGAIAAFHTKM